MKITTLGGPCVLLSTAFGAGWSKVARRSCFSDGDAIFETHPTKPSRNRPMSFRDREKAFENKFLHDAELKFKAEARRNKLLGLWVAERLGKSDDAAAAYAKEVVASDFEEAGDSDVVRKVLADLSAAGHSMGEDELRSKMADLMDEAIAQVQKV
jgi:hypothetical protein